VPAHLAGLVRTRAGAVDLAEAAPLDTMPDAKGLDPVALLPFAVVELDAAQARRARDGGRVEPRWRGRATLVDDEGSLVAVADADEEGVRYVRVWRERP
jgi:tRNA pseudouridine55 synthase